jgi:hypothetical protein
MWCWGGWCPRSPSFLLWANTMMGGILPHLLLLAHHKKIGKKQHHLQLYSSCKRHLLLKNCLIALNKLHKTLVASVSEINDQQNISPFLYYCMPFVYYYKNKQLTWWHMENEKCLKKIILKIDGGSLLCIFNSFRL